MDWFTHSVCGCDIICDLIFCFQDKWLGIVHHVCGEHEWDGRCCSHGPLTETEGGKEYLAMNSKAAKELKKIVLDRDWMKSLENYVYFRYIIYISGHFLSLVVGYGIMTKLK